MDNLPGYSDRESPLISKRPRVTALRVGQSSSLESIFLQRRHMYRVRQIDTPGHEIVPTYN